MNSNQNSILKSVPNYLTMLRIALIPLIVMIYQIQPLHYREFTTLIFFIASITDYLDGYMARKYQLTSPFGKFFDPVADKLLVTVSLLILAVYYQNIWITLASMIIISREILMSSFREWIASSSLQSNVSVSLIGKWKTTFQMLAIGGLFWEFNPFLNALSFLFLLLATILTLYSLFLYFKEYGYSFKGV